MSLSTALPGLITDLQDIFKNVNFGDPDAIVLAKATAVAMAIDTFVRSAIVTTVVTGATAPPGSLPVTGTGTGGLS